MLKGITYMVRPRMLPSKWPRRIPFSSWGSFQLLVGPASSAFFEEMKVQSSTRATSLGWERARKLLGRFSGLSRVSVPDSSMPAISRGRLFQFDRHGDQARLSAFESETGKFLWKFEYPTNYDDFYGYNNGPRCCPVVDDNRVYIHGVEGMLHCVRAADGKLIWKVDTKQEFHVVQNHFGVGSAPVVEGDLLLVHVGGSTKESGEEISVEIEEGKTLIIKFLTISEPHADGTRTVFFELNGQPRDVSVVDRSLEATASRVTKADPADPKQVGAAMPGMVVTVAVSAGDKVVKGQKLFTLEAMKMETTVNSDVDGRVAEVLVKPGSRIETGDLLLRIE